MEVSALPHPSSMPGLRGPSPLLRLQSDERLIALTRRGQHAAFETLCSRYQSRLLAFCRHMLGSREDAEDVLQEVFAAAFNAILADERAINVRPWLYRIARNRSLNHLRRASATGVDSMDVHFADHGLSTGDRVLRRESFRELISDVQDLPETQRTALLLREIDALSYEQIAQAMETTVPSVKSLLVRARISLAEAAEARKLSCEEVRLELGEVAEGLIKLSPPARRHVRACERCRSFKKQLKENNHALAAIFPVAPLLLVKKLLLTKLGSTASAGGAHVGAGATVGAGASVGAGAAAGAGAGGGMAGGLVTAGAGAIATKAAAGLAAAAIVTAGAVAADHAVTLQPAHPAHRARAAASAQLYVPPRVASERYQPVTAGDTALHRAIALAARDRAQTKRATAAATDKSKLAAGAAAKDKALALQPTPAAALTTPATVPAAPQAPAPGDQSKPPTAPTPEPAPVTEVTTEATQLPPAATAVPAPTTTLPPATTTAPPTTTPTSTTPTSTTPTSTTTAPPAAGSPLPSAEPVPVATTPAPPPPPPSGEASAPAAPKVSDGGTQAPLATASTAALPRHRATALRRAARRTR